jgi:hypothetical protein
MPCRPRTQVIGRVSWDIPCILYSSIIKKKFLLLEFTGLNETNLKVIQYGVAANALANIKRLDNKNFWQIAPEHENSRVSYMP